MRDISRPYTPEDLQQETVQEYRFLVDCVNSFLALSTTEEEREIIKKGSEIMTAPYHYALNPDWYNIDKIDEGIAREDEIQTIITRGHEIRDRVIDEMPPNMKILYDSISVVEKEKRAAIIKQN